MERELMVKFDVESGSVRVLPRVECKCGGRCRPMQENELVMLVLLADCIIKREGPQDERRRWVVGLLRELREKGVGAALSAT